MVHEADDQIHFRVTIDYSDPKKKVCFLCTILTNVKQRILIWFFFFSPMEWMQDCYQPCLSCQMSEVHKSQYPVIITMEDHLTTDLRAKNLRFKFMDHFPHLYDVQFFHFYSMWDFTSHLYPNKNKFQDSYNCNKINMIN